MVALLHDDLKSMGITSVGHRLTILKSVYDVKKAQDVPLESDHYLPLCKSNLPHALEPAPVDAGRFLTRILRPQLPMPKHSMPLPP